MHTSPTWMRHMNQLNSRKRASSPSMFFLTTTTKVDSQVSLRIGSRLHMMSQLNLRKVINSLLCHSIIPCIFYPDSSTTCQIQHCIYMFFSFFHRKCIHPPTQSTTPSNPSNSGLQAYSKARRYVRYK